MSQEFTKPSGASALDEIQRSAQEQFSRQSHRYGEGHVLEEISDVREARQIMTLSACASVLDVATGAGRAGLHLAGLGHRVTVTDVAVLPVDSSVAAAYAELRADCERRGAPVADMDLLIAATAKATILVVATLNTNDFHAIQGITVEDWSIPLTS